MENQQEDKWKVDKPYNLDQRAFNTFASLCYQEFVKNRPSSAVSQEFVRGRCQKRWQDMVEADKSPFYRMAKKEEEDENENYKQVSDMDELASKREDEEYQPARRKRKKDPNMPKRALNGFILYCQEERARVKVEFPEQGKGGGKGGVTKELARRSEVEICNLVH